jgi:hypothetical protein
MLRDSGELLLTVDDVSAGISGNQFSARDAAALTAVRSWIDHYLCREDPALGRTGPVCPYVGPSVKKSLLWLTVVPAADPLAARDFLAGLRRIFAGLAPDDGPECLWKAIIVVFPEVRPEFYSALDSVQDELKPDYVRHGLMIGQFYNGCGKPGIWNKDFRPLQAPVPLIAIRHMVPSDYPFMAERSIYLEWYFRHFARSIPEHVRKKIAQRLADDGE